MEKDKKYLRLNDIESYKTAFKLGNYVWEIVIKWHHFERDTVGKQFARAVDSVSANLSEGFGRHYKKDKILFYRIARGSVYESLDWNEKSKVRNLITKEEYNYIFTELKKLPKQINELIKYTNSKLSL